MIGHDEGFWTRLSSQFRVANRRGIVLAGPSGSGKSMLASKLLGRQYVNESTSRIKPHFSQIMGRITAVRDTPGDMIHNREVFGCLSGKAPEVLCLVFSGSYLHSVGAQGFKRPGRDEAYPDYASYMRATNREEIQWLKDFKKFVEPPLMKIKYLLLVVNKLDLWHGQVGTITRKYSTNAWNRELSELAQSIAIPNAAFRVVTVSADYDSFKGIIAPSASFDRDAADLSIDLLRALICLLQTDGVV